MPTVRTNDVETYYERRGSGPAVVFVHAAAMDHAMWDEQVAALADDYTVVTYDLRGHGRTGGSADLAYTVERYAEDLDGLLTALQLDRPVVCGLSLGGAVALTYGARHPDRLAGLVLADTFTPEIRTRGEWLLRRVVLNAIVPPVRLLGIERVERAQVWVAERLFGGSSGEYDRIEALRERGPRMATAEFAKTMRALARYDDLSVDLSAMTVPVLVLYGENELPFVERHAAALAAGLPDVVVDAVPGAGHASNLDDPGYFTGAVAGFLGGVYGDERGGEDVPERDVDAESTADRA